MEPEADEDLAGRARLGDEEAFGSLVRRYRDKIYRLAFRLSGNDADAEDIMQETFLRVFQNISAFRLQSRFSTWIYRIAANAAMMLLRARRRRQAASLDEYLPRFDEMGRLARADYDRACRAEEMLAPGELAVKVREAMGRLGEKYRAVLVLRDLEGLSTEETAKILDLGAETIWQRLHRARLMMRGFLGRISGGNP